MRRAYNFLFLKTLIPPLNAGLEIASLNSFISFLRTILSDEVPHKNILILQSEMWSQEGSQSPKKGKEIEWMMKCCLFSDCVACTICRHRDGSMTEFYQMFCCVCRSRGKSVHLRGDCMCMEMMDGREDNEYHPWTGKLKVITQKFC